MKKYLSTSEAARILGVSRITVFNKIKSGQIKTEKVGRNFIIPYETIMDLAGGAELSEKRKNEIEKGLDKVIKEYGETLDKLKDS